jgi:ATP-binding cassette subfamily B protein
MNKANIKQLDTAFFRLWSHLTLRRRHQIMILLVLMVVASFAEVISIGATFPFLSVLMSPDSFLASPYGQLIAQNLGVQEKRHFLLVITVLFILAALICGVLRLILLWGQTRLSFAIGADLSVDIYQKTLYQPYAVFLSRNSSELIAGISGKSNGVVSSAILPAMNLISSGLILGVILFALISAAPKIALLVFFSFGSIYGLVIFFSRRRLVIAGARISKESNQVIKALQEGLGGIRDVLLDGSQNTYCQIYRDADIPLRRAQADIAIIGGAPRFVIEALGISIIAILAFSLADGFAGVDSAIPLLGLFALGAQRLLPALQQLFLSWTMLRGGSAVLADTLALLDQPLPKYTDGEPQLRLEFQSDIALQGISFCYPGRKNNVLTNLSLTITKGSCIGIIGSTGGGKSTLLDIIMGLSLPTQGDVLIDGVKISEINFRSWQKNIAHVPQSIFLTDASIAQNIAFGIPEDEIDYQRVKSAAQKAQIAQTIESWEGGYQTLTGENGVRLSGGQRQRIGIARALYKNSRVVILDEATSALDEETEAEVMESIHQLDRSLTILIVAHRLSTLKMCDQIIVVNNGNIESVSSYGAISEALNKQ